MNNQISNYQPKKYDLEERTASFAEKVILLCNKLEPTSVNKSLSGQLTRAAGSIAANYYEATEAESKKDFIHKIGICKKESKETKLWLRLLIVANHDLEPEIALLQKEVQELLLIFASTIRTTRSRKLKVERMNID